MVRGGGPTVAEMQEVNRRLKPYKKGPSTIGLKWNNKVYTQKQLQEHFASTPGLQKPGMWGLVQNAMKEARTTFGVKREPRSAKKVVTENNNGNNEEEGVGESMGPVAWMKRASTRFKKSRAKKSGKGGVPMAPLTAWREGDPVLAAFYARQGIFNPAVIQAFSGSVLETVAFEAGVVAAARAMVPPVDIKTYRYDRKKINHPSEIFNHNTRTFIFKPRFDLGYLKSVSLRNSDMGMTALLDACRRDAGAKGEDHVETDIIEVIPRNGANGKIRYKVRLYESKIGEGKAEGFPGEAFQLLKGKRMTELFFNQWAQEHPGRVAPNGLEVECFFMGWQFSIQNEEGWAPTVFHPHRDKFSQIYKALELRHGPGWTAIETLNPSELRTKVGTPAPAPDARVIQSVLEADRQRMLAQVGKMVTTMGKRGTLFTQVTKTLKRTRKVLTGHRFVSGTVRTLKVPGGNIEKRREGQFANLMKNARSPDAKTRIEFSQKWSEACAYLVKRRIIAAFRPGANIGNAATAAVPSSIREASESFSLTNARNYKSDADLAEIIRRFIRIQPGSANLSKFSKPHLLYYDYSLVPVLGKLSSRPGVFAIIRRLEPNLSPETELFLGILEGRADPRAVRAALTPAQQHQLNAMAQEGPINFENAATSAYGLAGIME